MEKKQLGNSSVTVTPLAFGAWAIGGWMWGGADENEALRAIRASFDSGITTIDTAPAYGFGKSEELIAKAMDGVPREQYQILTKYGLNWETPEGEFYFDTIDNKGRPVKMYKYAGRDAVRRECENSLRRLRTDYIDLYQIHWADPTTPIEETMSEVGELIKEGKVRAAGVCNYTAQQVEEALKTVNIVSNQVPYSMVNRDIEKEVVPQAVKRGLGIIPYSPLQRGLLTGKITRDYKFGEGDTRPNSRFFKGQNIDRVNAMLQRLKPIADKYGKTLSQLVINWTANQPSMACVLVGARNEKQVKDNAQSLTFILTAEDINHINREVTSLVLD
jgi:aryl-alcohol dehydrogenase-like predicted oxidoreductase